MAFMAVDDGIAIGDTPRVFWRVEIATSHQPSECNKVVCLCCPFFCLCDLAKTLFQQMEGSFQVGWKSLRQSILLGSSC